MKVKLYYIQLKEKLLRETERQTVKYTNNNAVQIKSNPTKYKKI